MFNSLGVVIFMVFFAPIVVIVLVVWGIVRFFINRNINSMDPNQNKMKVSAKDVFLNLGAFIGFYTLIGSLLNLLFSIIEKAYPRIADIYYVGSTSSISWPVSILIVFFPIFVLLMYFLEKEYTTADTQNETSSLHKGLVYITLFVSGVTIIGDLITVVYYFINGEDLTNGFLLKVLVLLIIASSTFIYFISDLMGKLTKTSRIIWRFFAGFIVIMSIIWGFVVIGSPRTQRLYKYDEQKVSDLQSINIQITNYYATNGVLPKTIEEIFNGNYYVPKVDPESNKPYEYKTQSLLEYTLCAEFNKESNSKNTSYVYGYNEADWKHSAGYHCFKQKVNPNTYYKNNIPQTIPYSY
jgi:hypothetical protein